MRKDQAPIGEELLTDRDFTLSERVIDKAVRQHDSAKPAFAAIGGSHIYGFPSPPNEGGDIDLRGFHLVDGQRYLDLNPPQEQYQVNQGTVTQGFEAYEHIELVSYELRKFGSLLHTANFNVIETVFKGPEVMNGVPLEMQSLRALLRDHLPMDMHHHYYGMAKSNYWKYLNPNKESYRPTAKKYLYVLRGLLGARYVYDREDVTAHALTLAEANSETDADLVGDLIDVKLQAENIETSNELAGRADERITTLFNEWEPPDSYDHDDRESYRDDLNSWMRKIRK
jgi:predicted nucleotidyltransferase